MFITYLLTSIYLFSQINGLHQLYPNKGFFSYNESVIQQKSDNLMQNVKRQDFFVTSSKLEEIVPEEGSGTDKNPKLILPNINNNDCVEDGSNSICSNKGVCVNNRCVCNSNQFEIDNTTVLYRYTGKFCEECPFCRAQRCHQFIPCIECHSFREIKSCDSYCNFRYEIVEKVHRDPDKDEKYCDVDNSDGCFFIFKYSYDSQNSVYVHYERQFSCFNGAKIVILTFMGVIAYILILAILVTKTCCLAKEQNTYKSVTSLSRRHDVLRLTDQRQ